LQDGTLPSLSPVFPSKKSCPGESSSEKREGQYGELQRSSTSGKPGPESPKNARGKRPHSFRQVRLESPQSSIRTLCFPLYRPLHLSALLPPFSASEIRCPSPPIFTTSFSLTLAQHSLLFQSVSSSAPHSYPSLRPLSFPPPIRLVASVNPHLLPGTSPRNLAPRQPRRFSRKPTRLKGNPSMSVSGY